MQQSFADGGLTRGYRAASGGFDELVDSSGALKPHWQPLLQALEALDPATRALRMEQLNARVRETGIAHDLFSDPASTTQPWRVDLVPLIISRRGMARARARADPARPAVRGASSPISTDRSSCWHRAPFRISWCSAILPSCGPARPAAAGRLHPVLRHRPRARAGRALARDRHACRDAGRHRLRACQPHGAHQRRRRHLRRLQGACGWRRSSSSCRPRWRAAPIASIPTIALLTPGPRHSDFFSHAYLARYLGLLLVEGGDLRVAGDRVSLKTLHGLMPVDLIVRCIAGARGRPARARLRRALPGRSGCCRPCASIPTSWSMRWDRRSPRTAG